MRPTTGQKPIYYDSIDTLPIYNLDRYFATQDVNWFLIGYTGKQPKSTDPNLKAVKDAVIEEYELEVDNRDYQKVLQKLALIDQLTFTYNMVSNALKIMSHGFENTDKGQENRLAFIKYLQNHKFKMPIFNSPSGDNEHIKRIFNELQGFKSKIAILKSEISDEGKKNQKTLYRNIVIAKSALGLLHLDPRQTTVAEWIAIGQEMKELAPKN